MGKGKEAAIRVENVKKRYDLGETGFWALKGVDLDFAAGELIAIVGKSGSGKSTLLNLLGGIDRPTEGRVLFQGRPISGLREGQLSRLRGQHIGFVFQFFQLMPTLTVLENVMMPMDFAGRIPRAKRRERAMALLAKVGIAEQAGKFPSALSGGEQQRVAIARALANDPQVILADEPTGNLDSRTAEEIFDLLNSMAAEGKTVVMVTHNEELAERCSRVVRIRDGMILQESAAVVERGKA